MQWLRRYGYTELSIEGVGLIMSDLAVEFKSEAFYGDTIQIKISVGEITSVAFELYYTLSAIREDSTIIAAYAKTGMVCYDYAVKKVTPIPEKLKAILSAATG